DRHPDLHGPVQHRRRRNRPELLTRRPPPGPRPGRDRPGRAEAAARRNHLIPGSDNRGRSVMRSHLLVGFAFLLAAGCGGAKSAPGPGTGPLDGKPLANATVNSQPVARPGSLEAGPGSAGKTDDQGRYTLRGIAGQNGAVVGEHRVMVSLLMNDPE